MKTKGFTLREITIGIAILMVIGAMMIIDLNRRINKQKSRIAEAMKVFEPNTPTILRVSISQSGGNLYLEKVYCVGSDGNTVEQYVKAVTREGIFIWGGGKENILRKDGIKPYLGDLKYGVGGHEIEKMTPEQAAKLDGECQLVRAILGTRDEWQRN